MLSFLEALCDALRAVDEPRIRQLLAHPLARALPQAVHHEELAIANGSLPGDTVPLQAYQLLHQTAHLLGACSDRGARSLLLRQPPRRTPSQIELMLERAAG